MIIYKQGWVLFAAEQEEGDRNSLKVPTTVLQAHSLSGSSCCEELLFAIGSCGNISDDPLIVMD